MKSKGFTLIELLAVIVILAIIALIATPVVLNIISSTKESATLQSAQFYLDASEQSISRKMIKDSTFKTSSCLIENEGNLLCSGEVINIEVKGEVPNSGVIEFEKGKIIDTTLIYDDVIIGKKEEKLVYLESGLYDEEGNLIASWDELVNDYNIDVEKDYTFDDLSRPGEILLSNENLKVGTKLIIDNSVTEIGDYAFSQNTTLTTIIIPNSVINIGKYSVSSCTSLTHVIIPNSVTNIEQNAFRSCINLKGIIIPNSVTSLENTVFEFCRSLESVVLGNGIISMGIGIFRNCSNLKGVIILNNITTIAAMTFHSCENLKEIIIPNSVTTIDAGAFVGCRELEKVTLGKNVTSIENSAFIG